MILTINPTPLITQRKTKAQRGEAGLWDTRFCIVLHREFPA